MTPELKTPQVPMPYQGDYSQQDYARQMIRDYQEAGVSPIASIHNHSIWKMFAIGYRPHRPLAVRRSTWTAVTAADSTRKTPAPGSPTWQR